MKMSKKLDSFPFFTQVYGAFYPLWMAMVMGGLTIMPVPSQAQPVMDTDQQVLDKKDHAIAIEKINETTSRFKLQNGLQVIIKEDHRSPTMSYYTFYKAGSIDEVNGKTGLAHVLEHMMFKRTKTLNVGDFDKAIKAMGGATNAYTTQDVTGYYIQAEKSNLRKIMLLESERMANVQNHAEDFVKEIEVIKEERRMRTDDRPAGKLYEKLMNTIYSTHPYKNPVIGWRADLDQLTYKDAQNWYETWYAPNNATIVIAGDVTPEEVTGLFKEIYGTIPAKKIQRAAEIVEPAQTAKRTVVHKDYAENEQVYLFYKAPKYTTLNDSDEAYALTLLDTILSGYEGARLPKRLRDEQKIAQVVWSAYDPFNRGPSLFGLGGTPAPNKSHADLEKALAEQIVLIAKDGVTDTELTRAKSQYLASRIYARDSKSSMAQEIGQAEMTGLGVENIDKVFDRLKGVSKEQVQAVAQKYLMNDQTLTVGYLVPDKTLNKTPQGNAEMVSPTKFR